MLLAGFVFLWTNDASHPSECSESAGAAVLLQKVQKRHQAGEVPLPMHEDSEGIDLGTYGLAAIPESFLNRMVMGSPLKCSFLIAENDPRARSCEKTMIEAGLHPAQITAEGNQTYERNNALRLLFPVGSLPCCSTPPFCAAPNCAASSLLEASGGTSEGAYSIPDIAKRIWDKTHGAEKQELSAASAAAGKTCTKRSAAENYAYMVHPDVWPAYQGFGGGFELDVQKHWDILYRLNALKPGSPPFDLVIDLGANSGLMTEKFAMRRFAKDYIMVEAQPPLKQLFDSRFGNDEWRTRFISEESALFVSDSSTTFDPRFEFQTFALSDKSGGFLDTCDYQNDLGNTTPHQFNCTSEMATVDSIIPGRLSPDFASRFAQAQSAYVKVDTEGMDQKTFAGMKNLLAEKRGDDHLVNFLMLEYCAPCMETVRKLNNLANYNLKTLADTLQSHGFEAFIMGPRYLPITHGSWDESFLTFSNSSESHRCNVAKYPKFEAIYPEVFLNGQCKDTHSMFTADIFAVRSGHPQAEELKLALGACVESQDFSASDPQYDLQGMM